MVRRIFLYCSGFRPAAEASRGDKISGIRSRGIVAAEAGVPGVPIRMAVMEPPQIAPKEMASSMEIPAAGFMP